MEIKYVYRCDTCAAITEEYRQMADRNTPFPCACGGTFQRKLVPIKWNEVSVGGLDPGFPGADMKWERDREARKKKEQENVEKHGTEFPNLRDF